MPLAEKGRESFAFSYTGPAERSKSWLGHSYMLGIICLPPSWNRVKEDAKRWFGRIPTVPPYSAGSELHEQGPQEHGREYILTAWGIRYWRTTYYPTPGLGFWTRRIFFTGHFIEVRIKIMPDFQKTDIVLLWENTISGLCSVFLESEVIFWRALTKLPVFHLSRILFPSTLNNWNPLNSGLAVLFY